MKIRVFVWLVMVVAAMSLAEVESRSRPPGHHNPTTKEDLLRHNLPPFHHNPNTKEDYKHNLREDLLRHNLPPFHHNSVDLKYNPEDHSLHHNLPHARPLRPHAHVPGRVTTCGMCPSPYDITPCMCTCMNSTVAELTCESSLTSCDQLTHILNLATFPTNFYIRLIVTGTGLDCKLDENLWGPLMFQEILMTDNQFNSLDTHAFTPFSNTLVLLNLERNLLTDVSFWMLNELPNLETVLLGHNQIPFLPGSTFMKNERLRSLSLTYNNLNQIGQYTFAELPRLESLNLSHNQITRLPTDAFTILDHNAATFTLDLSFNNIEQIESGVLWGPTACNINLQHNQLTTLEESVFRPLVEACGTNNSHVWVSGNPFLCDERLCWLVMNATVSQVFDKFRCPNLNNEPADTLLPLCSRSAQDSISSSSSDHDSSLSSLHASHAVNNASPSSSQASSHSTHSSSSRNSASKLTSAARNNHIQKTPLRNAPHRNSSLQNTLVQNASLRNSTNRNAPVRNPN